MTDAKQVLAARGEGYEDAATALATDSVVDFQDLGVPGADVAQRVDQGFLFGNAKHGDDGCALIVGEAVDEPAIALLEMDQNAHGKSLAEVTT